MARPGLVARIHQGSGHINMGLGLVLTIQGVGAALSNPYGGLFARHAGYGGAFLALATAPCMGLALFGLGAVFWQPLRAALRQPAEQ